MTQANTVSAPIVDELGVLLAQIANLTKQAEAIKSDLKGKATGEVYVFEGALFKANVIANPRSNTDYKAMVEALGVPANVIAKYTTISTVITLKVTSR